MFLTSPIIQCSQLNVEHDVLIGTWCITQLFHEKSVLLSVQSSLVGFITY